MDILTVTDKNLHDVVVKEKNNRITISRSNCNYIAIALDDMTNRIILTGREKIGATVRVDLCNNEYIKLIDTYLELCNGKIESKSSGFKLDLFNHSDMIDFVILKIREDQPIPNAINPIIVNMILCKNVSI